jgi:hypothetical protein
LRHGTTTITIIILTTAHRASPATIMQARSMCRDTLARRLAGRFTDYYSLI